MKVKVYNDMNKNKFKNTFLFISGRLGGRGKTIVFSIHQPRYSIYKLFDTVTLLSGGECVYHGSTEASLDYFQDLGKCWEENQRILRNVINDCFTELFLL